MSRVSSVLARIFAASRCAGVGGVCCAVVVIGYWVLGIGYWVLGIGFRQLAALMYCECRECLCGRQGLIMGFGDIV